MKRFKKILLKAAIILFISASATVLWWRGWIYSGYWEGTQSEKGNPWVERILSFKQTCQMRSLPSFPLLVNAIDSFFKEQKPNLDWLYTEEIIFSL